MTYSVEERSVVRPLARRVARPLPGTESPETVGRGLRFALGAVLTGVVATVVVWRLGFVVSMVTLATTAGAAVLYSRGAGASARRGLLPLVLMIVGGAVLSFFAVVASDAWDAYGMIAGSQAISRADYVARVVADPVVLGSYGRDMTMSGVYLALALVVVLCRRATARA